MVAEMIPFFVADASSSVWEALPWGTVRSLYLSEDWSILSIPL
jgi:hypothetical protein